jgi:hypothetical protein
VDGTVDHIVCSAPAIETVEADAVDDFIDPLDFEGADTRTLCETVSIH